MDYSIETHIDYELLNVSVNRNEHLIEETHRETTLEPIYRNL